MIGLFHVLLTGVSILVLVVDGLNEFDGNCVAIDIEDGPKRLSVSWPVFIYIDAVKKESLVFVVDSVMDFAVRIHVKVEHVVLFDRVLGHRSSPVAFFVGEVRVNVFGKFK